MSLYSDIKSWASRRLQQSDPDTFVEGGGSAPSEWFSQRKRERGTLEEYEDVYKDGGPIAQLIDTRALMTFGTGSEFVSERPEVAEWLDRELQDRDNFFVDLGRDSYIYGDSFAEIVETQAGGFSHLELVSPKTLEAEWDDHGQIQAWVQSIQTGDGQTRSASFAADEIAHFAIRRLGRQPLGISLVGQNRDEARRFAQNQEAISHALELHGWPKYHIRAGREGGQAIGDTELRRVRSRFRNFDEKTQFVTGVDIGIEELDTGDLQIEGVTEHDLMVLAAGYGVPEEMAGLGRGSTEATAKVRLQAFERMARSEQRALADQFIKQVVRPLLDQYSPFARDVDVDLTFDDVVSDQTATAEWLGEFKDVYTVDEMREKLGDGPHEGDDDELGPPQPQEQDSPFGVGFGGGGSMGASSETESAPRAEADGGRSMGDPAPSHSLYGGMNEPADLTDEERAFHRCYTEVLWHEDTDRALLAYNRTNVPESVRENLIEAAKAGALFSEAFETAPSGTSETVKDELVSALKITDGWTINGLTNRLRDAVPGLEERDAERIARTETQSVVNKGRELYYEERFPDKEVLYKWNGPGDHRTTDACEWLKEETAGGVPMRELKELIQEAPEHDPDINTDPREYTPHIQCRHSYFRVVPS